MAHRIQQVRKPPALAPRQANGHKGLYGHILVVGGSRGMIGAVALAANAALRGGAGLVTFAAPETVQLSIAGLCPCATSAPLSCGADGQLSPRCVRQMLQAAENCDVLAVGPGLAVGKAQQDLIQAALEQERPVVLDADGLNNLALMESWPILRRCPLVLTPHPGEFARLTGRPIREIQADRRGWAIRAVTEWTGNGQGAQRRRKASSGSAGSAPEPWQELPLVVVLKGAATVVTDGRRVYVNDTGNPGMATGGTGDILTGLAAALLGQGMKPFDAACLAVHAHGLAGDLAARELGQVSMIAWDLLDCLPKAMKSRR